MGSSDLVRYSRAGDVFHYRWAARRCLEMIYPNRDLQYIVIEGSADNIESGEYAIDVTEYYSDLKGNSKTSYYQLKHTTVQQEIPFELSDVKKTITGFAERYKSRLSADNTFKDENISFSIVTNRPFSDSVHDNLQKISSGQSASKRFTNTLESYTGMSGVQLSRFCKLLSLHDSEGNYLFQKNILIQEISILTADQSPAPHMESIVALVQDKALPDNDGKITPQEVLQKFGAPSERALFPAPSKIDSVDNLIVRKMYTEITGEVFGNKLPSIVHASGGVGKSIYASYLSQNLPSGSIGILYDCFDGGGYRKRSTTRHRHHDGLVQIINDMALKGLCDPIIIDDSISEKKLTQAFNNRLGTACAKISQINENAKLFLIIDAADNAEMAAKEFSEPCFVHELLKESYPDTFKLIVFCRTERISHVDPEGISHHIELSCFDLSESSEHIRHFYPECTDEECVEFHRLTSANPRVQINELLSDHGTIRELLSSFNNEVISVDSLIRKQLDNALSTLKANETPSTQESIDNICVGLATLPPFIPISVLGKAASVPESMIKSFITDMGRPLWLVDDSAVQFRDEPTETWFRQEFSASQVQIKSYVSLLRPLAKSNVYISEALPALYHRADMHDELVRIALSDEELPQGNPTIARDIRVFRLQFALKASLKLKRYDDAIKLAFLAGEETAGKARQLELLSKNIDLIKPLQSRDQIQTLAYRRVLEGDWSGSENLYAASLLSMDKSFTGEASNFLRAAHGWLKIYFNTIKKDQYAHHTLKDEEVSEFAYAINNIDGIEAAVSFLCDYFKQGPWISRFSSLFVIRLIDSGDITTIDFLANLENRNIFFLVALADELMKIGKSPSYSLLDTGLTLLACKRTRMELGTSFQDRETHRMMLVSFLEACAKSGLSSRMICRAINIYFDEKASNLFTNRLFNNDRCVFLRILALKSQLTNQNINIDELMPVKRNDDKNRSYDDETRKFKPIVESLLPWYQLRVALLLGKASDFSLECKTANEVSGKVDLWMIETHNPIRFDIYNVKASILQLCGSLSEREIENFYTNYLSDTRYARTNDIINVIRSAYRMGHLSVASGMESIVWNIIVADNESDTESKLDNIVMLARAVYAYSTEDAATYFNYAVEHASRFGDEIVQRWDSITSLAKRASKLDAHNDNLAYRYFRCAELVGENVGREKYWNRNEAVRTCVNLSPATAIAALSRWRDREVGWFARQIHALAHELVSSGHVSPMEAWSFIPFYEGGYYYLDFASMCINKAANQENKQFILDSAVYYMQLAECSHSDWTTLKDVAIMNNLASNRIDLIIAHCVKYDETFTANDNDSDPDQPQSLDGLFDGIDVFTPTGLDEVFQRLKGIGNHTPNHARKYLVAQVPQGCVIEFVFAYIQSQHTDLYDTVHVMRDIIGKYHDRISVKTKWSECLSELGYRFSDSLVIESTFRYYTDEIIRDDNDLKSLQNGIIRGFTEYSSFTTADTCFGIICSLSNSISSEQANSLLDFGLTRFEHYVDEDFGDGSHEKNQLVSETVTGAISGFIWNALGSPHSTTRWRATHAVKLLAASKSQCAVDMLMMRMQSGETGVYGHGGFPFYKMHAELYLLIALLRVAVDDASVMHKHRHQIGEYACEDRPHILMQKISAEICLIVEKQFKETYTTDSLRYLESICTSPFPLGPHANEAKANSYLHEAGLINIPKGYHHGLFFREDWFKPLGSVFNVSSEQVEDLATDVILNHWKYPYNNDDIEDPRMSQWRHKNIAYYSKGSYPQYDTNEFYLSYHAMLSVASKLLRNMPVVQRYYDDDENPWEYWLKQHWLTRNDGRWISDRRDPPPLYRPNFSSMKSGWETINDDVFFDSLLNRGQRDSFITVYGYWEENDTSLSETYSTSSAFIPIETTDALLIALSSFDNCHDYKIPNYREDDDEYGTIKIEEFTMKGWIAAPYNDKSIDERDPFAANIHYPPYEIGDEFVEVMNSRPDSECKYWYDKTTSEVKAIGEIWCSDVENPERDSPLREGMRISVHYDSLLELCRSLDMNLLLKVAIKRAFKKEHYSRDTDKEYKPPKARLFVISKDGIIRQGSSIRSGNCQESD